MEFGPRRALAIDHILSNIFQALRSDKDLRSAARSCKAFSGPALDCLWRSLYDNIIPLLKILPNFKNINGRYVFVGNFEEAHWDRFDSYARRVHELWYTASVHRGRVDPSVFIRLSQLRNDSPIFPALRSLAITSFCEPAPEILLFVSPSLRQVEIGSSPINDHTAGTFLQSLASRTPCLQHLTMDGTSVAQSFLSSIVDMHGLRYLGLQVDPLDLQYVHSLASLDNLVELYISLHNSPVQQPRPRGRPRSTSIGFLALQHLCIEGDLSLASHVLELPVRDNLESVTIHTTWPDGEFNESSIHGAMNLWWNCFSTLAMRFPNSLRHVTIGYETIYTSSRSCAHNIRLISFLEPLLLLERLSTLIFDPYPQLSISDSDVLRMASAWPHIMLLCLPYSTLSVRPTFLSLRHLARLCPNLNMLELTVDTRDVAHLEDDDIVSSHGLANLQVGPSFIDRPLIVARHMALLFPSLMCVTGEPPYADEWKNANDVLNVCRVVRADQLKRSGGV